MTDQPLPLKPCPFCGNTPAGVEGEGSYGYPFSVFCCWAKSPACSTKESAAFWWNNAYCWKLLAAKEAEIREMGYALEKIESHVREDPAIDANLLLRPAWKPWTE